MKYVTALHCSLTLQIFRDSIETQCGMCLKKSKNHFDRVLQLDIQILRMHYLGQIDQMECVGGDFVTYCNNA